MKWVALALASLLAVGCGSSVDTPDMPDTPGVDAGCSNACGGACCSSGESCVDGRCQCVPQCEGKQCGSNGCGGSCGTCDATATCNPQTNRCDACVPESDAELCGKLGTQCGPASTHDRCGQLRTIDECGGCVTPETCNVATGLCFCAPEPNDAFCARLGKSCGSVTAADNCGDERTVNCGSCRLGQCDLDTNQCVCDSEGNSDFCGRLSIQCGPASGNDNCERPRTVAECGPCLGSDLCEAATGLCRPCPAESDEAWCAAHAANCGTVNGTDSCGNERAFACGSCSNGRTCGADHVCALKDAPRNDYCFTAERLTFDAGGVATVKATTTGAADDGTGSCGGGSGADLVYSFTLTAPKSVEIVVTPGTAAYLDLLRPVVYLRRGCDDAAAANELGCSAPRLHSIGEPVIPATVRAASLPPGTYFVWVDSQSTKQAGFDLLVRTFDPAANDQCAGAIALPAGSMVLGDTRAGGPDTFAGCGGVAGPDLAYSFTLSAPARVELTLVADTSSPRFRPQLFVRGACDQASTTLACAAAALPGTQSGVVLDNLAAGTYFVWVSGGDDTAGMFALSLVTKPPSPVPAHDVCTGAQPLAFTAGRATVQGETVAATHGDSGTCATMAGREVVYSFELLQPAAVAIALERDALADFDAAIYLRSDCASVLAADEKHCSVISGPRGLALVNSLPAGTYHLFVDALSGAGAFTLEVDLFPPVTNDSCAGAVPLAFDANGEATVRGDLRMATAGSSPHGNCGTAAGNDLVYSFTLGSTKNVSVTMTADDGTLVPILYARTMCEVPSTELGCARGAAAAAVTLPLSGLAPGTYYVWADADGGTNKPQGAFTLKVTATDPPRPPADTCTVVGSLTFDATNTALVALDTTGNGDDYSGTCSSEVMDGPDLVYGFTLTSESTVSATLLTTRLGAVYIRSECGRAGLSSELACAVRTTTGTTPITAVATALPPGVYYVFVDAISRGEGPANLEVRLTPPVPNGDCATTTALAFDPATGKATVTGDTSVVGNTEKGTCHASPAGNLVYPFTLATAQEVEVKLTTTGSSKPVVYVRSTCTRAESELGCAFNTSTTANPGVAQMTLPVLEAGTYYVVVDGTVAPGGPFTLDVTTRTPASTPTNTTCAAPQPLVFANDVATASGDLRGAGNTSLGSCMAGYSGADLVYSFTLASPAAITAKVVRDTTLSPALDPAIYIRSACNRPEDEVVCGMPGLTNGTSTVNANLLAGTYFVFVDAKYNKFSSGVAQLAGAFNLEVTRGAYVTNDTCATAELLTFDQSGIATVNGDTTRAVDDARNRCDGTRWGRDVAYKFELTRSSDVRITVTPTPAGATGFTPGLYVRTACNDPATELTCYAGNTNLPADVTLRGLQPGTYYVWVDGKTGQGTFELRAETTTPPAAGPANDACAGAEPLVFTGGVATLLVDTALATDNSRANCAVSDGPDRVYTFTLADPSKVTVRLTRESAGGLATHTPAADPVVYLRSQCDSRAIEHELACARRTNATPYPAENFVNTLQPGTYWVWVDSEAAAPGRFSLTVTVAAPAAVVANDSCTSPEPLTFSNGVAVVSGSTAGAANDGVGTCDNNVYPDVVYSFTLTQPQRVVARAVPATTSTGFKPVVYVRSQCAGLGGTPDLACNKSATNGKEAVVKLPYLTPGTYFVWVDGAQGVSPYTGSYQLTVTTETPNPPPANNTCGGAIALAKGVAVDATTVDGLNEYGAGPFAAVCGITGALAGNDLVYSYTPAADGWFSVTARAAQYFDVALWVTAGICSGDGSACVAGSNRFGAGSPETVWVDGVAGTTYFVVVDGVAEVNAGTFSLVVN